MTDWKADLGQFFDRIDAKQREKEEARQDATANGRYWVTSTVLDAFEEVASELRKYGRKVSVEEPSALSASINVLNDGQEEFVYIIGVKQGTTIPYCETRFANLNDGRPFRAEGALRSGHQNYKVTDITKDEIIAAFLTQYKAHVVALERRR